MWVVFGLCWSFAWAVDVVFVAFVVISSYSLVFFKHFITNVFIFFNTLGLFLFISAAFDASSLVFMCVCAHNKPFLVYQSYLTDYHANNIFISIENKICTATKWGNNNNKYKNNNRIKREEEDNEIMYGPSDRNIANSEKFQL